MNDKEIWEDTFKNKEDLDKFETKPGPPLTKEQVENAKAKRKEEKEKQLLESLQNQIKILEEELNKVKKVYKQISRVKQKPQPQPVIENNESNTAQKQIKQ